MQSDLHLLVNLPEYPFNSSQTYWTESIISRILRMREHARHELLGAPSADWNPSEVCSNVLIWLALIQN